MLSLKVAAEVFRKRHIFLAIPENIDIKINGIETQKFNPSYFSSLNAYGELVASEVFYTRFLKYEYLLIYQLDSFAFTDSLDEWCEYGYDHIAPTILKRTDGFWPLIDTVGVGGFSLRRVKSHIRAIQDLSNPNNLRHLESRNERVLRGAEDMYWTIGVPKYASWFIVSPPEVGLKFGIEGDPYHYKERLGRNFKVPFGCHHWNRLKFFPFFLPLLWRMKSVNTTILVRVAIELARDEGRIGIKRIRRKLKSLYKRVK